MSRRRGRLKLHRKGGENWNFASRSRDDGLENFASRSRDDALACSSVGRARGEAPKTTLGRR